MENQNSPKRIDLTKPSFIANGTEYFVQSILSISRFCEFQILEKELSFSMSFQNVFNEINEATELMNEVRFVEVAVKLDNLRRGIAKLEEKEPTALKICTLFINTKDEDLATWNNDLMTKKIEDWKAEGIAIQDFFQFALNTVNGFIDTYKKMSEMTSVKDK